MRVYRIYMGQIWDKLGQNWDKIGTDFLILFRYTIYITRGMCARTREKRC